MQQTKKTIIISSHEINLALQLSDEIILLTENNIQFGTTTALIAKNGIQVHGVDINQNVVDTINQGKIHIVEPSLDIAVEEAVKKGFLKADIKPVEAETYLIVVPTMNQIYLMLNLLLKIFYRS